jgi:hypothetical protein
LTRISGGYNVTRAKTWNKERFSRGVTAMSEDPAAPAPPDAAPAAKGFSFARVVLAVVLIVGIAVGGWGSCVLTGNAGARNGAQSVFDQIQRLIDETPDGAVQRARVYQYVRRVPTSTFPGEYETIDNYVFDGWNKKYTVRVTYWDNVVMRAVLEREGKL